MPFSRSGSGDTEGLNTRPRSCTPWLAELDWASIQAVWLLALSLSTTLYFPTDNTEPIFCEQGGKFSFKKVWGCCAASMSLRWSVLGCKMDWLLQSAASMMLQLPLPAGSSDSPQLSQCVLTTTMHTLSHCVSLVHYPQKQECPSSACERASKSQVLTFKLIKYSKTDCVSLTCQHLAQSWGYEDS